MDRWVVYETNREAGVRPWTEADDHWISQAFQDRNVVVELKVTYANENVIVLRGTP